MHLSELKALHVSQLLDMAVANDIEGANRLRKHELIFALLKNQAKKGETIFGDGTLETLPDGFGFLRSPDTSYLASTDDIYVSPSQIRRFNLHTGDTIEGEIRTPKDGERYFALVKVDKVNGEPPEASKNKILFENLTPLHPEKHIKLEREIRGEENTTSRIIDIISPIGKGQRGLLVSSPKSGKTVMMQHIAHAITANHPDINLIVLLIDERPEEVTEMTRSVRGEVVASTFDEPATRHVQVAEMVIEKAKRLVEHKKDVVQERGRQGDGHHPLAAEGRSQGWRRFRPQVPRPLLAGTQSGDPPATRSEGDGPGDRLGEGPRRPVHRQASQKQRRQVHASRRREHLPR